MIMFLCVCVETADSMNIHDINSQTTPNDQIMNLTHSCHDLHLMISYYSGRTSVVSRPISLASPFTTPLKATHAGLSGNESKKLSP
jgi:hypothetical protein